MKDFIIGMSIGMTWVSFIVLMILLGRIARLNQRLRLIEQEMSYKQHEYSSLKRRLETRVGLIAEL